ncbi:hypothetical protein [uncultured Helcococcus sp.]|uniref:hypothetical protein n=1 Tax=uncultured Helcococcus sp. TaxID=1072508 RepID=UPI00261F3FF0|nr:hypothetical protein [uncultured Helcococcus sp.]
MRKIIYIVTLIFTLLILVACQNKKLSDILDIKEDKVQKIVVETTMTEDKSDLVLEKKDYKKFLDKILSYNIVEEKEYDGTKGWQYLIRIKSDKDIFFSISDNIIYLDDKMYISNNLNKNDLLYLFKNK